MDGLPMIRVDNPNEIVFEDEIVEQKEKSLMELKECARVAFEANDFEKAISFYNIAIGKMDKNNPDKELLGILYSNKASCLNLLGKHELAIEAALRSLEANPAYAKARYNLAKGFLFCDRLNKARNAIDVLLSAGKNKDVLILEQKFEEFLMNKKGVFDWAKIIECVIKGQKAEIANYINPKIEIKKTEKMGLGVFANQPIGKGELLAVVKPFSVVSSSEADQKFGPDNAYINYNSSSIYDATLSILSSKIISICSESPLKLKELFQMCDSSTALLSLEQRKERVKNYDKVTTEEIRSLVSRNVFETFDMEAALKNGDFFDKKKAIFIFGAFFNHNCDSNAVYWILENFLVIFSAKQISPNSEIFLNYFASSRTLEEKMNVMKSNYEFICDCSLCQPEQKKTFKKLCDLKMFLNSKELLLKKNKSK